MNNILSSQKMYRTLVRIQTSGESLELVIPGWSSQAIPCNLEFEPEFLEILQADILVQTDARFFAQVNLGAHGLNDLRIEQPFQYVPATRLECE